jgi:hypothetical protein
VKNIILLTVLIFISLTSIQAQGNQKKINRVYMFGSLGPSIGDATGSSYGISGVVNNKWIASLGRLHSIRNASLPSDFQLAVYEVPWLILILLPIDPYYDYRPEEEVRFTYASFGRYYPLSRKISFIIDGGVGVAKQQGFKFYKPTERVKNGENIIPGVSSNYTVTSADKTSIGAIARVGADWAFSGGAGMGLDLYYNANMGGISDIGGLNIRFMVGYMPRRPKNAIKY